MQPCLFLVHRKIAVLVVWLSHCSQTLEQPHQRNLASHSPLEQIKILITGDLNVPFLALLPLMMRNVYALVTTLFSAFFLLCSPQRGIVGRHESTQLIFLAFYALSIFFRPQCSQNAFSTQDALVLRQCSVTENLSGLAVPNLQSDPSWIWLLQRLIIETEAYNEKS